MIRLKSSVEWRDKRIMSIPMDERSEALRVALQAAATYRSDGSSTVRRNVRDAVCAFVEEMRDEGAAPEEIVAGVRSIAKSAGVDYFSDVASTALRWTIAHYFGAPLEE